MASIKDDDGGGSRFFSGTKIGIGGSSIGRGGGWFGRFGGKFGGACDCGGSWGFPGRGRLPGVPEV